MQSTWRGNRFRRESDSQYRFYRMACLPFLNLVVLGIATMAAIGHKREEKVPPGTMARRHCMESVGLRCANPTYLAWLHRSHDGRLQALCGITPTSCPPRVRITFCLRTRSHRTFSSPCCLYRASRLDSAAWISSIFLSMSAACARSYSPIGLPSLNINRRCSFVPMSSARTWIVTSYLRGLASEFTGLRGFSCRSGGMMGWASHNLYIEVIFAARSNSVGRVSAA